MVLQMGSTTMLVNVCCSASSGSTFFSTLLNNHPEVVCGSELGLFSKPIFYNDFYVLKRFSWLIDKVGISSRPYFNDRSILRNLETYGLDRKIVWRWIKNANSIIEFVEIFYNYINSKTSKSIWAEKTPENIFLIKKFAEFFPDEKIIHIVRDPRDVILSLMKRGHSDVSAARVWLTSVASIQTISMNKNVLEIRYEDLISEPEKVLSRVCSHLEIEFDLNFFLKEKYKSKQIVLMEGISTWSLRPKDGFSKKAIGKYKSSGLDFNELINMRITKKFATMLGTKQVSIRDLMYKYHYDAEALGASSNKSFKKVIDAPLSIKDRFIGFVLHEGNTFPLVEY